MAGKTICRNCGDPTTFPGAISPRKELGYCGKCYGAYKYMKEQEAALDAGLAPRTWFEEQGTDALPNPGSTWLGSRRTVDQKQARDDEPSPWGEIVTRHLEGG